jgi:hypothetical protein
MWEIEWGEEMLFMREVMFDTGGFSGRTRDGGDADLLGEVWRVVAEVYTHLLAIVL